MEKERAKEILCVLKKRFPTPAWSRSKRDPFQSLIVTIISQNTNDRNTGRAFENLSRRFSITPKALAEADVKDIEASLRVAGLYRNKSKVIKEVSRIVLERFGGSLDFIYSSPQEEARRILMAIPGIGPKTADVVLLFCAGRPTVPVDTHVNRVSKRLGFASLASGYDGVQESLQSLYPSEDFLSVHLTLIMLGREYCKARKPLCKACPVNQLCPSRQVGD